MKEKIYLCGDLENNKIIKGTYIDYLGNTKNEYATEVYLSSFVNIFSQKVEFIGYNINSTMIYLLTLLKRNPIELYFHNLKYDGKFIIDYLLKNGFTHTDKKLALNKCFTTLITPNGMFYEITIKLTKGKNANKLVIRDSLKIFPLKVEEIAKVFNLDIQKGEIDYSKYDNMHSKDIEKLLTKEEIDYCVTDVKIVARALQEQFLSGYTKMTSSSNAMEDFKIRFGKGKFKNYFPTLDMNYSETETVDAFIRSSYKGGYTYVNPKFKNRVIKEVGQTYDVNSLYPSVMYNKLLPYGMPLYFKGRYKSNKDFPLYIQRLKCHFKLKEGFIPTIQIKGGIFSETEYLTSSRTKTSSDRITLTLTNVDLEIFFKHYDVSQITWLGGLMFEGEKGIFCEYIDYWGEIKKTSKGGRKQLAKLMLNSLYGKFASSTEGELKEPYLENNIVKYRGVEGKKRPSIYTAMASFITSYAREITQCAFQENINICCYADTDSIHIIGKEPKNILIDEKELGYWKLESTWIEGKFIRAKTYYEEIILAERGNIKLVELDIKCAGMPKKCKDKITKENFKQGTEVFGKLIPLNCDGGVILEETTFTIK